MSNHHQQQYTYNQPIYTNTTTNTVQNASYGAYKATNYHTTKKSNTKPENIVYQEQIIEQPAEQYVIEENAYIPQGQYTQGIEYTTDNQGVLYEYQQGTEIQGYDQNNVYQQQGEQVIYQEQPGQQIVYQEQPQEQIIYQEQPQEQVIYQEQPGQQAIYYEQQGEQVIYQEQPGQNVIYQEQPQEHIIYQEQPGQQVIYQDPQIYEQNPQYIKEQRKAKYVKQMVTQKPNIKQISPYQQQEYITRNPNLQNIPHQYNQQKMLKQDKPFIDSDFQPSFGLPNSIIGQSQINFDQNPNQQNLNVQNQPQVQYNNQGMQSKYVAPVRNPDKNIKKYNITNSHHYIKTNDPGSSAMKQPNYGNNNYINQSQSSNKGANMKSKIPQEQIQYSIDPNFQNNEEANKIPEEEEDKPEVGEGVPFANTSINNMINDNITNNQKSINLNSNDININNNNINQSGNVYNDINKMSNNNNIINNSNDINNSNNLNSNVNMNNNINNNINMSGNENNENFIENQKSHEEMENENPIEEKVPDVNNMANPDNIIEENYKNYQPHYNAQEVHESKLKESIDLDDTLDPLPTIDNILKGIENLLPPPNKTKYDE